MTRKYIITISVLMTAALIVSGCAATHQKITVSSSPKPEIVAVNGKPTKLPRHYIIKKLKEMSPEIEEISINDRFYLHVTEKWFLDMIVYTRQIIDQQVEDLAVPTSEIPGYGQVFATFMNSLANISVARHYNTKGSVLMGLAVVKNEKPWGKIPADGAMHDYIIALTHEGGLIHDLETSQTTRLKDFPNLKYIHGVLF